MPPGKPATTEGREHGTERLAALLAGRRTLVLSGAGISTESGIPDYRSPERLAKPRKPMLYQTFVGDAAARRRYWARSLVGWRTIGDAEPNDGHRALARLEAAGVTCGLVTQNVDSLHQKAGSRDVLELHGSLASILCLDCRALAPRDVMQRKLLELNPGIEGAEVVIAPDGDADLPDELVADFRVPDCDGCGGLLKPHVVFFGENVPRDRVTRTVEMLDEAEVLLVVGSSLTVMSGLRFVLAAQRAGKPVAIVNQGPTRADDGADLKLEGKLGKVLPQLAGMLTRNLLA